LSQECGRSGGRNFREKEEIGIETKIADEEMAGMTRNNEGMSIPVRQLFPTPPIAREGSHQQNGFSILCQEELISYQPPRRQCDIPV
jgi:hypothetical protein